MTANRQSGVSVSVVLDHLRGSFTEGKKLGHSEILRLIYWVVNGLIMVESGNQVVLRSKAMQKRQS